MAAIKKTVTPATEKKTTASVKVEAPKAEVKKTETVKAEPVKETVKKVETVKKEEAVKKETPAKKTAVKKETAVKAPARKTAAKKAELKSELHIQFGGKSYSQEDLVKIAKDVWKYDLKQKAGDLKSIEVYVKPEENVAYYVMNGEFTGSFYI